VRFRLFTIENPSEEISQRKPVPGRICTKIITMIILPVNHNYLAIENLDPYDIFEEWGVCKNLIFKK